MWKVIIVLVVSILFVIVVGGALSLYVENNKLNAALAQSEEKVAASQTAFAESEARVAALQADLKLAWEDASALGSYMRYYQDLKSSYFADLLSSNAQVAALQTEIVQLERDKMALQGTALLIAYELEFLPSLPSELNTKINWGTFYEAMRNPGSVEVLTDGTRAIVRVRDLTKMTGPVGQAYSVTPYLSFWTKEPGKERRWFANVVTDRPLTWDWW